MPEPETVVSGIAGYPTLKIRSSGGTDFKVTIDDSGAICVDSGGGAKGVGMRLVASGTDLLADDAQVDVWTGLITAGKPPMAIVGCEDDVALIIVNDNTITVNTGYCHFFLHKTAVENQYSLRIRQNTDAARNISWAIYEQGA